MKITKHITFFFLENRICYINNIINETNTYEYTTDIYIHTNNKDLQESSFNEYKNGSLKIIAHDLSNENPFYLTWKCRDLLKQQMNDYDVFMYIEDDILVPYKAIQYWLEHNEILIENGYNLGFVRIEVDNDNEEYITDLTRKLNTIIKLNDIDYCINNINSYCAFWIYNKNEFSRFVSSNFYNIQHILNITQWYGIREASAIGLHDGSNNWYKGTLIPIINNKLIDSCRIYHMQNNYVISKCSPFAKIKFNEAFQ